MQPARGLGQFDIDANTITGTADAPFKKVTHIDQAADLGRREAPTLELKAR